MQRIHSSEARMFLAQFLSRREKLQMNLFDPENNPTHSKTARYSNGRSVCRKTPIWPPLPANSALRPAMLRMADFGLR